MVRIVPNQTKVVPSESSTWAKWTHPPFSGHYDGEYVWGRGSEDDKSNLIAILTAIDCLISQGFSPLRTVIVSIGFDEEGGAEQSYGARCLANLLLERYGHDGIEMIVSIGMPRCTPAHCQLSLMKASRVLKDALAQILHCQQPPRRAMWTSR